MTVRRSWLAVALLLVLALAATPACTSAGSVAGAQPPQAASVTSAPTGMPRGTDQHNVYAAAGANMLSDAVRTAKPLVYVPHTESGDLWEIDPATYAVVAKYPLGGGELQHVVPSWDLRTLYVTTRRTG